MRSAELSLAEIVSGVAAARPHRVSALLRTGSLVDEILSAVAQADMLVLGARGSNPLRDFIVGTTAERLLRKCGKPALIVKQPAAAPYQRVLVPVDFSADSDAALETALALAPEADIHLLHAFDVPFEGKLRMAGVPGDEINAYRIRARNLANGKLHALKQPLEEKGRYVRICVEYGDPYTLILEKEKEIRADLIAIGKHGQSVLEELFLGSVTRHVLSDAACDVLVAHGVR
jgi:nucleotide-binding universal stress UspA family protein